MNTPNPELAVTRDTLDRLAEAGQLDAPAHRAALAIAGFVPDARRWHDFLSRFFLLSGAVLLVAAIGYFVAYNWEAMGRFAKIGLLELALIAAAALALYWPADEFRGRVALLAAVLLIGPLFAFIGQTYQTGADTFELFRAWALLALPWALLARWRPVWCAWLVVANLALSLYFTDAWRPWFAASTLVECGTALLLFNALFLLALEMAATNLTGGALSAERLAIAAVLTAATMLYLQFLFDVEGRHLIAWLLGLGAFAAVRVAYESKRLDLVALAMWAFAAVVCSVGTVGKVLFEARAEAFAFLMTGLSAIGLSAWAALWLRQLHRGANGSAE